MYLLAAQCATAQQRIGEQTNTLLRPCAADEAFGGGTATSEFDADLQGIGDGRQTTEIGAGISDEAAVSLLWLRRLDIELRG